MNTQPLLPALSSATACPDRRFFSHQTLRSLEFSWITVVGKLSGLALPRAPRFERVQFQTNRARLLLLAAALVLCPARLDAQSGGSSHTYYVSSAGDDGLSGTLPSLAWRTIGRVNQQTLRPGDSVFF